jgi:hypothetical protein
MCRRSGECRLALPADSQQFVANLSGERVVLLLELDKLSLKVAHAPLQATHFRYQARIRPANVTE